MSRIPKHIEKILGDRIAVRRESDPSPFPSSAVKLYQLKLWLPSSDKCPDPGRVEEHSQKGNSKTAASKSRCSYPSQPQPKLQRTECPKGNYTLKRATGENKSATHGGASAACLEVMPQWQTSLAEECSRFRKFADANRKNESIFEVVLMGLRTKCVYYANGNVGNLEIPSEPGQPRQVDAKHGLVSLEWDPPRVGHKHVDCYEVKYRRLHEKTWEVYRTDGKVERAEIPIITGQSEYEFQVRCSCEPGYGPFSDIGRYSNTVDPRGACGVAMPATQRPTSGLKSAATEIEGTKPKQYKLSLESLFEDSKSKTRRCTVKGFEGQADGSTKTIVLLGETGVGKSTLINAMVNYIAGVRFEDEHRLTIIDKDGLEKKRDKSQSQTDWVTCYTIPTSEGSAVDFTLRVIDTPGFGDTRGIQRDKEQVEQLRTFFTDSRASDLTHLDAACFIVKASDRRMSHSQKYILNSMQSLFGKDMDQNILVLTTFSELESPPPVLRSLTDEKVTFAGHFSFNNSALFTDRHSRKNNYPQLFWELGQTSLESFFKHLATMKGHSLDQTLDVLQMRNQLRITTEGLTRRIDDNLTDLLCLDRERIALAKCKNNMNAHSEFTYETEEMVKKEMPLSAPHYATNCRTCQMTCHYPCLPSVSKRVDQYCHVMANGKCTVCPGKCAWKDHACENRRFECKPQQVTKTIADHEMQYMEARERAAYHTALMKTNQEKFERRKNEVVDLIAEIATCTSSLNEIGMKPVNVSPVVHILDTKIAKENKGKTEGCEMRISLLEDFRRFAGGTSETKSTLV